MFEERFVIVQNRLENVIRGMSDEIRQKLVDTGPGGKALWQANAQQVGTKQQK